ncbi:MAG: 1-deoxy-D-xylulose-5-phosphate reductoisomerase [Oscillospiraceae bacterium]|jgi:1-deoxy-D-xylulose-5-phosphate reductoisomerase|nr:1-deoxy-D-xylulose-5-phosphate reductoisomerase [Oscillospiraceae bacterium]
MLSLIGSTGSVGKQTLEVLDHLGQRPVALTAGSNVRELEKQCRKYIPELAVLADENAARDLKTRLADTDIRVLGGNDAICEAAAHPKADTAIIAVSGLYGLNPTLAAIGNVKRLAPANKESLVYAGPMIIEQAAASGTELIPIDSELSAIHQCIELSGGEDVEHIIITASGGPFYGRSLESMHDVTVEEALQHPTWCMGKKITVDSATMLNKGYEIFEAMYYFNIPAEAISVAVHRESIVHSIVQFNYGATVFHLAVPDMRLPIQYALTYPERLVSLTKPLDLISTSKLTFTEPDTAAFPCLKLAMEAAKTGGYAGVALAASGEAAVERFLNGTLRFTDIAKCVEAALTRIPSGNYTSIDDIFAMDTEIRSFINKI